LIEEHLPAGGQSFYFEGEPDFEGGCSEEDEEEADGGLSQAGGATDNEQNDDDLSVAWEVLDTARIIYSGIDEDDAEIKLGDIYILLGDVSLENGD
jgi:hypothetical protein